MEKKTSKVKSRDNTIPINFTIGELKAAMIACGQYNGSFQKHPRAQRSAWKKMQSIYITHEIYG